MEESTKTYTEEYVHDLREEAAGYRTKWAPYRDAFAGLTEPETELVLEMVRTIQTDRDGGAVQMASIAHQIAPEAVEKAGIWETQPAEKNEQETTDMPEYEGEDRPLTLKELQDFLDAREQQAQQTEEQRELARLKADFDRAGVDFDSYEGRQVMLAMAYKTDGDFDAAVGLVTGEGGAGPAPEGEEPEGDEAPDAEEPAEESTRRHPRTATRGSVDAQPSEPAAPAATWAEASERALARLSAQPGQ